MNLLLETQIVTISCIFYNFFSPFPTEDLTTLAHELHNEWWCLRKQRLCSLAVQICTGDSCPAFWQSLHFMICNILYIKSIVCNVVEDWFFFLNVHACKTLCLFGALERNLLLFSNGNCNIFQHSVHLNRITFNSIIGI